MQDTRKIRAELLNFKLGLTITPLGAVTHPITENSFSETKSDMLKFLYCFVDISNRA